MLSIPDVPDLWTVVALVDNAGANAVDRVRRRGAVWWRAASACPGWTRADAVAHLVAGYAAADQALEVDGGQAPETYRTPRRPSRDAVLADQLAVVVHDAVEALRTAGPGAPARYPDRFVTAETVAAVLLAETLVHLNDVDPQPLPEDAAGAVIATLHPTNGRALAGEVGSFGELLLRLERGPGEWHREVG